VRAAIANPGAPYQYPGIPESEAHLVTIIGATTIGAPRFDDQAHAYDALLFLSFGGPEGEADVIPFLENVTAGRNVPRERLLEVAGHYGHFGGISPITAQNRALIAALEAELEKNGPSLPIYFGNRNWHPFVTDTIRQMRADGVQRALVFVTSAFSSYSGCRQYREDVVEALDTLGDGGPVFDKIRVFYNHPGFIEPMIESTQAALDQIPAERRSSSEIVFTAHSIPLAMSRQSAYVPQLREAARLIASAIGAANYRLAYQSRSGSPRVPWLEPDILDELTALKASGRSDVVVVPLGFISDHMEVLFDLDYEAMDHAAGLGMTMVRAGTVGTHPAFVRMIRDLILERMSPNPARLAIGRRGPNHDICPLGCCLLGTPITTAPQPA
jgi:protoporphyrin/coproporphyrin ferrochelatase